MYFAKYLPVEGEITDNDYLVTCEDWTYKDVIWNKDGAFMKGYKTAYSELPLTKVKLFLCSRDIQIGDKFFAHTKDGWMERECKGFKGDFIIMENGSMMIYKDSETIHKVIGEISPDALSYVKEGDIKEEDIEMITEENDPDGWLKEQWGTVLTTNVFNPRVNIKCPTCGNFH